MYQQHIVNIATIEGCKIVCVCIHVHVATHNRKLFKMVDFRKPGTLLL